MQMLKVGLIPPHGRAERAWTEKKSEAQDESWLELGFRARGQTERETPSEKN